MTMQDRLNYRVWDKENKEYTTDSRIFLSPNGTVRYIEDSYWYDNVSEYYDVEFCTGLKDKNSKLIYEGDILGGIYGGFIKWCDKCKCFAMFYEEHCFSCNGDILWFEIVEKDGELEVIGNIHENPNLVENKDE